jgi:membrane-bound lytic murein transglycosylase F
MNSSFFSEKGNKISAYDNSIKKYSKQIGWDWRIIAALIYEESQFNNDTANYRSGAFGIMQLMPATAVSLKIDSNSTIEASIRAGVLYLKSLEKQFMDITDPNERIKFVLAAYNAGIAHIFDARRLAKKYGKSTFIWDDNVEYYIRKKSNRKYYTDPVVYYGYYRGDETYWFVRDIMERYQHYRNVFK